PMPGRGRASRPGGAAGGSALDQFGPAALAAVARNGSGPVDARATLVRGLRLVKVQYAKFMPRTEPRNVLASVFTRLKQGSNGMPLSEAQTASLFALSVPAGSMAYRTGPRPPIRIVPATEPSAKMRPAPLVPSKQE